jgi:hypothetical protein
MFNPYSARAADIDSSETRPPTMTEKRLHNLLNIILNSLEHTPAILLMGNTVRTPAFKHKNAT